MESSEQLSAQLRTAGIPHSVLNAKNDAAEAEIIAQAGALGAVTISTNMAGRGTDILLGGNPPQSPPAGRGAWRVVRHWHDTSRSEADR